MSTGMLLQARMTSFRLPGKTAMLLAGRPLLARIIERVKRCESLDAIIVIAPDSATDDIIEEIANEEGVDCFRGSPNNLVDRHYRAARKFKIDTIVRLPADNPTPEPSEIDRIVGYHKSSNNALSTNLSPVFGNMYPDGIGAEVFDMGNLEKIWKTETDPVRLEHPHRSFFDYESEEIVAPITHPVGTITCPREFQRPDLCLDVNTQMEFNFLAALYQDLYPQNPLFHVTDIIDWYDNRYDGPGRG